MKFGDWIMERALKITRDIDKNEQPWMGDGEVIYAGETVYEFHGCTYGCIGDGIAVSREPGKEPFFEVPQDAVATLT